MNTEKLHELCARLRPLAKKYRAALIVLLAGVLLLVSGGREEKTDAAQTQTDARERASDLGNTAVVVAPLVPWSIAGATPLSTVGAPTGSLLAACFLYLLPLWTLLRRTLEKRRGRAQQRLQD